MSMNVNNNSNFCMGATLGVVGMNAYFLPVTKDRFVRNAYNIHKEIAEDKIELLNKSAEELSKNKLSSESKIFLKDIAVAENIDDIANKCAELKKSFTDDGLVKTLKTSYANNFKNLKSSEALRDTISSKAFSRIKWTNLGWGAAIGFILGSVAANAKHPIPPQG